jgi:hypothetical protein
MARLQQGPRVQGPARPALIFSSPAPRSLRDKEALDPTVDARQCPADEDIFSCAS